MLSMIIVVVRSSNHDKKTWAPSRIVQVPKAPPTSWADSLEEEASSLSSSVIPELSRFFNVALLRAFWSLLAGIWGVLKGTLGVLVGAIVLNLVGNHPVGTSL